MADIDIERKSSNSWLWWLLGLLALALIIWLVAEMLDDDEPETAIVDPVAAPAVIDPVTPPVVPATLPAGLTAYMSQCTDAQGAPTEDMGLEHQFTINCLQQLREAMNGMITGQQVANTDVSTQFDAYTSTVQQLQASDPAATTHANLTRDAATTASEVIQAMQTAWYGANTQAQTAVGEVRQAAQGIQPGTQMLEQRDSVRAFFREAGEALQMMAGAPAAAPVM